MLASQDDIRNRIEQLKFSSDGYRKQISRPGLSNERRLRLEASLRLVEQEVATLEKLAQFGRLETDREKIAGAVSARLAEVRERLATDPGLASYSPEERDQTSGEARALLWALGEDRLVQRTLQWARETAFDPERAGRTAPALLERLLAEGADAAVRAGAAYELGKVAGANGIPALVRALQDEEIVAAIALQALTSFTDEELTEHDVQDEQLLARIRAARGLSLP